MLNANLEFMLIHNFFHKKLQGGFVMCANKLPFPQEKMAAFDLQAFVRVAEELNVRNSETFTTPFPKDPSRLRSHYQFVARPIELNEAGEPEGGLSRLLGSVIDLSFVRSLFAPCYSREGGHCHDPASLFLLTLAAHLDGYSDYAAFCRDLRQRDKGRSYREMAGIGQSVPGEDDLCNFRRRVGAEPIDEIVNMCVGFLREFGLLGEGILSTDGRLEPSWSRYKGCAHFCEGCGSFPLNEGHREELVRQIRAGETELRIVCPFPEARERIMRNMGGKGRSKVPEMILLRLEFLPPESSDLSGCRKVSELLSLPEGEVPPMRIVRRNLDTDSDGSLIGRCPKFPSDGEAGVGYHGDNQNPGKKKRVFGYLQMTTTAVNPDLGLEFPIGNSTHPASVREGTVFLEHRSALPVPFLPGQVHLSDSAYDRKDIYREIRGNGGIPVIAYNSRNESLSDEALLNRGHDRNGTPYAPCGRLCRSNGYDYESDSRQHVCGKVCPPDEREECPHAGKVGGFSRRMSFESHPRLIGPVQRGTDEWQNLYNKRTSAERINGYDQEVVAKGRRQRFRGLKAFSFSGSIRTLAQLLRKTLNFVLSVTHTLGGLTPLNVQKIGL